MNKNMNFEEVKRELDSMDSIVKELNEEVGEIKSYVNNNFEKAMSSELDNKIKELENNLKNCEGTKTEVYTRIVGYYRAVDGWNKGKKEEYRERKTFDTAKVLQDEKIKEIDLREIKKELKTEKKQKIVTTIYLFTKENCPKCPPVYDYIEKLDCNSIGIEKIHYKVDEESMLNNEVGAAILKYNIMSTPTVLILDVKGKVIGRAHSIDELEKFMERIIF